MPPMPRIGSAFSVDYGQVLSYSEGVIMVGMLKLFTNALVISSLVAL